MGTELQFLQDEKSSGDSTVRMYLIPLNCTLRMHCHLTHIRVAVIKKARNSSAGRGMEKREPLCTVSGNVNGSHYGRRYGVS